MYNFIYTIPKSILYLQHNCVNRTYNYNIVYSYIHN